MGGGRAASNPDETRTRPRLGTGQHSALLYPSSSTPLGGRSRYHSPVPTRAPSQALCCRVRAAERGGSAEGPRGLGDGAGFAEGEARIAGAVLGAASPGGARPAGMGGSGGGWYAAASLCLPLVSSLLAALPPSIVLLLMRASLPQPLVRSLGGGLF